MDPMLGRSGHMRMENPTPNDWPEKLKSMARNWRNKLKRRGTNRPWYIVFITLVLMKGQLMHAQNADSSGTGDESVNWNDMKTLEGRVYQKNIGKGEFPLRNEILLERERNGFGGMANELNGPVKGEWEEVSQIDYKSLRDALLSGDPVRSYAASFLIGRMAPLDGGSDQEMIQLLREALDSEIASDVAIEASMSLALLGEGELGRRLLLDLMERKETGDNQYKAAFYLAQMGDISGYPIFLKTLESDIAHFRLMAIRHLVVFQPFEGQFTGGVQVNVDELMKSALKDKSDMVRSEIPFYLEELGIPDLIPTLTEVQRKDRSKEVRIAAEMVIERNR